MSSVKQALIIAAGNGTRLQPHSGEISKPLTPVCGVPLLKRLIHSVYRAGVESCVIVLGYQAQELRKTIENDSDIPIPIRFVMNDEWEKRPNGISVLKAKEYLKEDFVLLMADHLFQPKTLARFLRRRPSPGEVILAVDRKIDQIFDIDDATKVLIDDSKGTKILDIGKKIKDFNAVDTGMFLCSAGIFPVLEKAAKETKGSLSEAMNILISQEKLRFFDIGEGWWLDVDTPVALRKAEKTLFDQLRQKNDGFVARYINRPLSLKLTKFLVKTPIRGDHITLFNLFLGFLSALCFAFGSYPGMFFGGLLFQALAILDGCDGELAKIKLQQTSRGKFLDTLSDNLTFLMLLIGLMVGYYRQQEAIYVLIVGFFTIFDAIIAWNLLAHSLKRFGDYSLLSFQEAIQPPNGSDLNGNGERHFTIWEKFFYYNKFLIRRDTFAFFTFLFALFGKLSWIFWFSFLITHFMVLAILSRQTKNLTSNENPSRAKSV